MRFFTPALVLVVMSSIHWAARAADIPLPLSRPLAVSKEEKRALRDLIAKSKMSQRHFERSLMSSTGKGRLE